MIVHNVSDILEHNIKGRNSLSFFVIFFFAQRFHDCS